MRHQTLLKSLCYKNWDFYNFGFANHKWSSPTHWRSCLSTFNYGQTMPLGLKLHQHYLKKKKKPFSSHELIRLKGQSRDLDAGPELNVTSVMQLLYFWRRWREYAERSCGKFVQVFSCIANGWTVCDVSGWSTGPTATANIYVLQAGSDIKNSAQVSEMVGKRWKLA